jgi:glycosyltransferase involved in cell wall biosynthesis
MNQENRKTENLVKPRKSQRLSSILFPASSPEMRILVLCYEYPPLGGGGGRVAQSIAEQMAARGHSVRVQTAALGWKSVRETLRGVEVFRTASGRRVPDTCTVREMAQYCATSFLPTLRHIREWKPDVIHAHFAVPTGALAWAAHKATGTPYVLTAHLGDVPGGVPEQTDRMFKIIGPLARRIWQDAAATTAVSSFVQQLAERAYGKKVTRILNGIDLSAERLPPPEPRRQRHLVFIGRLNPQKNPMYLLDVLARLLRLPWRLTFIGDGPLMGEVRERIARHGLGDFVHSTGWLDAAEVQRVLADADILCMPSLSEGLPVVAIEALNHGLAIIATDIPGVRDVVDDGLNGYRVPFGNIEAFAHKLQWLIESDATLLAMKHASWEKARSFDLTRIADEYEAVLKSAAAKTNHGEHGARGEEEG